jgi:hypothetical protein
MKTKGKVLIGLMSLCLAGGAGGAFALTRNASTATGTAGAFDKAIYLNWATDSQSITISDVENLSAGTAQYRSLTVAPKSTKSVEGVVTLTFTLAVTSGEHHIKGLSVVAYETSSLVIDNYATAIDGLVKAAEINETVLSDTIDISITSSTEAHETTKYYVLAINWNGAFDSNNPTYTMSGNVTIAQSFSAA